MRGAEEIGDPNDILHPYFVPSQYGQAGEEKWRCEGAAPKLTRYRRFGFPRSLLVEPFRQFLVADIPIASTQALMNRLALTPIPSPYRSFLRSAFDVCRIWKLSDHLRLLTPAIETCRRLLTTQRFHFSAKQGTSASLSCSAGWNPAPASASACAC